MSFSFGRNWRSYARFVSEKMIAEAESDIVKWLGADGVKGKTVIDIGCGSGIHSLCFYRLCAKSLLSIDVDPHSVICTKQFQERAGVPENWRVLEANVLDRAFTGALGRFDIVYSWGVLHHTGKMWEAIDNASRLCRPDGGRLWIALYAKGPSYEEHLISKADFNASPWLRKQRTVWQHLFRKWRHERWQGNKSLSWFWHGRGMNAYHDAIDWYGGLPYEVASVEEVTDFLRARGFTVERIEEAVEGGCSNYLLRRL